MARELVSYDQSDLKTLIDILRSYDFLTLASLVREVLLNVYTGIRRDNNQQTVDVMDLMTRRLLTPPNDEFYSQRYVGELYTTIEDSVTNHFLDMREISTISPALEEDCDYYCDFMLSVVDHIVSHIESLIIDTTKDELDKLGQSEVYINIVPSPTANIVDGFDILLRG